MKLIEAMKKVKAEGAAVIELSARIKKNSALTNLENPEYGTEQAAKVSEWVQGARDRLFEIERLRVCLQYTNVMTKVSIELPGGNTVTKTIAGWLQRRGVGAHTEQGLAAQERAVWANLTDRGLRDGQIMNAAKDKPIDVKVVRFFDPNERDKNLDNLLREASVIDAALEIVNATTDLIEKF